jgi:excisionase family DNA binding protein
VSDLNGADEILTDKEVAELLRVKPSWVGDRARAGLIPHFRLGHYRRYKRGEVLEWFEQQRLGPRAKGRK